MSLSLTVQVRISQDKKSSATIDAGFLQSYPFIFSMVVNVMDGKRSDLIENRSVLVFYYIRIRGRTYMNLCRPQDSNP